MTARPVGRRLADALRDAYKASDLTQVDIAEGMRERGWSNVDQSKISKWARGMERVPIDALPVIEDICGLRRGTILRAAGFVDDGDPSVDQAVRADPSLTPEFRRQMLSFYEFCLTQSRSQLAEVGE